jgi:hypothetical protein
LPLARNLCRRKKPVLFLLVFGGAVLGDMAYFDIGIIYVGI